MNGVHGTPAEGEKISRRGSVVGEKCVVGFCSRVHDVDLHGIVRCVHTSAHGTGMATLFGLHDPRDRLGNYVWE